MTVHEDGKKPESASQGGGEFSELVSLSTELESGTWSYDKLIDALKRGNETIRQFGRKTVAQHFRNGAYLSALRIIVELEGKSWRKFVKVDGRAIGIRRDTDWRQRSLYEAAKSDPSKLEQFTTFKSALKHYGFLEKEDDSVGGTRKKVKPIQRSPKEEAVLDPQPEAEDEDAEVGDEAENVTNSSLAAHHAISRKAIPLDTVDALSQALRTLKKVEQQDFDLDSVEGVIGELEQVVARLKARVSA